MRWAKMTETFDSIFWFFTLLHTELERTNTPISFYKLDTLSIKIWRKLDTIAVSSIDEHQQGYYVHLPKMSKARRYGLICLEEFRRKFYTLFELLWFPSCNTLGPPRSRSQILEMFRGVSLKPVKGTAIRLKSDSPIDQHCEVPYAGLMFCDARLPDLENHSGWSDLIYASL